MLPLIKHELIAALSIIHHPSSIIHHPSSIIIGPYCLRRAMSVLVNIARTLLLATRWRTRQVYRKTEALP
jgi:hypothetical protein